ncbi:MAG: DUF3137 domain-containing protein [Bacilli bacterium]|nr:DUF3137 domain-containing protein [Bacilli bacterium]
MNDFTNLNIERKKCANLVGFGIPLLIIGGILFMAPPQVVFLGIVFFIGGGVLIGTGVSKFQQIKTQFKEVYLKKVILGLYENATYDPRAGLPEARVYRSGLLKRADRYHSEDLITGSFSDVQFETCDLKLEERHVRHTKNGTQVYYVTYFLGRFFEFEFPKNFKGKIIVSEGSLMTWFTNLKKMELESVEFNKKFKTYSSDELNTFYVLTPHLMESLMELERQNPGTIACSFDGNRLTIIVNNNRDTFDLKLFSEINDQAIVAMKKELAVIENIIEELRLNRNIFITKEENI